MPACRIGFWSASPLFEFLPSAFSIRRAASVSRAARSACSSRAFVHAHAQKRPPAPGSPGSHERSHLGRWAQVQVPPGT